ncbi:BSD domain-containing protein 1-like [Mangifera indica]|uniref:BSD domain-containing protein 1-like n=1 Tax=Mangifera indica TaxID=29780 RepID=UPI001CFA491E|nr:BSD domain-containing protein 1-like [Mangifera indica]
MNFFKSVFSDDAESESSNTKLQPEEQNPDPNTPPKLQPSNAGGGGGGGDSWSFGGLLRTLTVKSESVIETYRRDLQEFGTGLRKELEVAQGSVGTVGTVIDEFGNTVLKGTAQIISHGKDAILAIEHEFDSSDNSTNQNNNSGQHKPYSRFDAQVRAIQGDVNTYCEEVDDLDDYDKWKSGFVLDTMNEEIESLFEQNGAMESIYKKVVPSNVDHETFWCRYFYRVFKLKQTEDLRTSLVKRAISGVSAEEEEVLSWDVDDEDGEDESQGNVVTKLNPKEIENVDSKNSGKDVCKEAEAAVKSDLSENKELGDKKLVKEDSLKADDDEGEKSSKSDVDEVGKVSVMEDVTKKVSEEKNSGMNKEDSGLKLDGKVSLTDKGESESSKNSDISVVSSQPSMPEEEDLGWDEIEDLSSMDEKKVTRAGSPTRADLRKRLSVAEEEEDLSWDIEDDDEPVKA